MEYIRLLRPKHYLKNLLIFLPLIFSGKLLNQEALIGATLAMICFSLVASTVYIINDLKDRKLDRMHPKKKKRPIASGKVSVHRALAIALLLITVSVIVGWFANFTFVAISLLGFYLLINILYSFGLKNIPIMDVAILSLGFVIRVYLGAEAIGVEVSHWLYLAILAFSFYLSLGKRRNEIKLSGLSTRAVNKYYTHEFLDKNMYVCLALTLIYYSLWAIDPAQSVKNMFLTVPLVLIIVMTYSLAVESNTSDGDPVNVVLANKPLVSLVIVYGISMILLIYPGQFIQ